MPCITIPLPTIPKLPAPFSFPIPAIPVPDIPNFCCKLPPLPIPKVPITFPPFIVNPAFIAALNILIGTLNTYLDSIPLSCPKE